MIDFFSVSLIRGNGFSMLVSVPHFINLAFIFLDKFVPFAAVVTVHQPHKQMSLRIISLLL